MKVEWAGHFYHLRHCSTPTIGHRKHSLIFRTNTATANIYGLILWLFYSAIWRSKLHRAHNSTFQYTAYAAIKSHREHSIHQRKPRIGLNSGYIPRCYDHHHSWLSRRPEQPTHLVMWRWRWWMMKKFAWFESAMNHQQQIVFDGGDHDYCV